MLNNLLPVSDSFEGSDRNTINILSTPNLEIRNNEKSFHYLDDSKRKSCFLNRGTGLSLGNIEDQLQSFNTNDEICIDTVRFLIIIIIQIDGWFCFSAYFSFLIYPSNNLPVQSICDIIKRMCQEKQSIHLHTTRESLWMNWF